MKHKTPQEIADERRAKSYWTKQDVAAELCLTTRTINERMKKREIPFFKFGKRTVRFSPQEVRDALSRRRVASKYDPVT